MAHSLLLHNMEKSSSAVKDGVHVRWTLVFAEVWRSALVEFRRFKSGSLKSRFDTMFDMRCLFLCALFICAIPKLAYGFGPANINTQDPVPVVYDQQTDPDKSETTFGSLSNNLAAWIDSRNGSLVVDGWYHYYDKEDVYLYDFNNPNRGAIRITPGSIEWITSMSVSGAHVVWVEWSGRYSTLRACTYNPATGTCPIQTISNLGKDRSVYVYDVKDSGVVFVDGFDDPSSNVDFPTPLKFYSWDSGAITRIGGDCDYAQIAGSSIFYTVLIEHENTNNEYKVFQYDLSARRPAAKLIDTSFDDLFSIESSGSKVVWTNAVTSIDEDGNEWDDTVFKIYDVPSSTLTTKTFDDGVETNWRFSGSTIISTASTWPDQTGNVITTPTLLMRTDITTGVTSKISANPWLWDVIDFDESKGIFVRTQSSDPNKKYFLLKDWKGTISPPPVSVDIKANGSDGKLILDTAAQANITWTSRNADSCVVTSDLGRAPRRSGNEYAPVPNSGGVYTITCTGAGGTASDEVSAAVRTVLSFEGESQSNPGVTGTDIEVPANGTFVLRWFANADSCSASGSWNGTLPNYGAQTLTVGNVSTDYSITCTGAGGSASSTVHVTVPYPPPIGINITANGSRFPATIAPGSSAVMAWTSSKATSCTRQWKGISAAIPLSGSETLSNITSSSIYRISCTQGVFTSSESFSIRVDSRSIRADIRIATADKPGTYSDGPVQFDQGTPLTLSWNSANASACIVTGPGVTFTGLSGERAVPMTGDSLRYTLSCDGASGKVTDVVEAYRASSAKLTVSVAGSSATSVSVAPGATPTVTWRGTNVSYCFASGDIPQTSTTSGSVVLSPILSDRVINITCDGGGYGRASKSIVIRPTSTQPLAVAMNINGITNSIDLNPGDPVRLFWQLSGDMAPVLSSSIRCTASAEVAIDYWTGDKPSAGAEGFLSAFSDQAYFLTCQYRAGGKDYAAVGSVRARVMRPDFRLSYFELESSPIDPIVAGTDAAIVIGIANYGNATSIPTTAILVMGSEFRGLNIPAIGPFGIYSIRVPYRFTTAGTTTLSITVDYPGKVIESSELNNSESFNVVVGQR